jgi:hypothetical protein
MIMTCTCIHEGQDKIHGKNQRVFNALLNDKGYRCTVCLGIKGTVSVGKRKKK